MELGMAKELKPAGLAIRDAAAMSVNLSRTSELETGHYRAADDRRPLAVS